MNLPTFLQTAASWCLPSHLSCQPLWRTRSSSWRRGGESCTRNENVGTGCSSCIIRWVGGGVTKAARGTGTSGQAVPAVLSGELEEGWQKLHEERERRDRLFQLYYQVSWRRGDESCTRNGNVGTGSSSCIIRWVGGGAAKAARGTRTSRQAVPAVLSGELEEGRLELQRL